MTVNTVSKGVVTMSSGTGRSSSEGSTGSGAVVLVSSGKDGRSYTNVISIPVLWACGTGFEMSELVKTYK